MLTEFSYKLIIYDIAKKKLSRYAKHRPTPHVWRVENGKKCYVKSGVDICLTCDVKWIQVKVGTKIYRVIFHRCTQINQIGELITAGTF